MEGETGACLAQKTSGPGCRKELEELLAWKGSMEVILEVNSVKIQRQGGDFHGLRDKVMKLHTEFDRVQRRMSSQDGTLPITPISTGNASQSANAISDIQGRQKRRTTPSPLPGAQPQTAQIPHTQTDSQSIFTKSFSELLTSDVHNSSMCNKGWLLNCRVKTYL